ncbi:hypothetical protein U1Q18_027925 [Sarracenia purpurea var. burkii]
MISFGPLFGWYYRVFVEDGLEAWFLELKPGEEDDVVHAPLDSAFGSGSGLCFERCRSVDYLRIFGKPWTVLSDENGMVLLDDCIS